MGSNMTTTLKMSPKISLTIFWLLAGNYEDIILSVSGTFVTENRIIFAQDPPMQTYLTSWESKSEKHRCVKILESNPSFARQCKSPEILQGFNGCWRVKRNTTPAFWLDLAPSDYFWSLDLRNIPGSHLWSDEEVDLERKHDGLVTCGLTPYSPITGD